MSLRHCVRASRGGLGHRFERGAEHAPDLAACHGAGYEAGFVGSSARSRFCPHLHAPSSKHLAPSVCDSPRAADPLPRLLPVRALARSTKYDAQQTALTDRIVEARKLLKQNDVSYDFRVKISQICSELNVDGIRGDIVTNRAAKVRHRGGEGAGRGSTAPAGGRRLTPRLPPRPPPRRHRPLPRLRAAPR